MPALKGKADAGLLVFGVFFFFFFLVFLRGGGGFQAKRGGFSTLFFIYFWCVCGKGGFCGKGSLLGPWHRRGLIAALCLSVGGPHRPLIHPPRMAGAGVAALTGTMCPRRCEAGPAGVYTV